MFSILLLGLDKGNKAALGEICLFACPLLCCTLPFREEWRHCLSPRPCLNISTEDERLAMVEKALQGLKLDMLRASHTTRSLALIGSVSRDHVNRIFLLYIFPRVLVF